MQADRWCLRRCPWGVVPHLSCGGRGGGWMAPARRHPSRRHHRRPGRRRAPACSAGCPPSAGAPCTNRTRQFKSDIRSWATAGHASPPHQVDVCKRSSCCTRHGVCLLSPANKEELGCSRGGGGALQHVRQQPAGHLHVRRLHRPAQPHLRRRARQPDDRLQRPHLRPQPGWSCEGCTLVDGLCQASSRRSTLPSGRPRSGLCGVFRPSMVWQAAVFTQHICAP